MTDIGIKNRLAKVGLAKDKSISGIIESDGAYEGVIVTYSRDELSLDSIADIVPLARRKPDSICQAVDYMFQVRSKPRDEDIIVTLAKPRQIASAPSESVESLVVKGVSLPLKSYSSMGITRLATNFIGGLDILMSQSLSVVFGLVVNISMAYMNYRKRGSSLEYLFNLIMLFAIEALMTLILVFFVGLFTDFRHLGLTAVICALVFFVVNFIFKGYQQHRDKMTAKAIDIDIDEFIFKRSCAHFIN